MHIPEERFEDLSGDHQKWLRDQHPRGAQIIAAMRQRDAQGQTSGETVTDDERTPESSPEPDVPPYEKWSKKELVEEATARGLDASGNKDDLVARLYQHDEETEDQ